MSPNWVKVGDGCRRLEPFKASEPFGCVAPVRDFEVDHDKSGRRVFQPKPRQIGLTCLANQLEGEVMHSGVAPADAS